jgi:predicted lipoprotein with Yx(FWY)xxD motif
MPSSRRTFRSLLPSRRWLLAAGAVVAIVGLVGSAQQFAAHRAAPQPRPVARPGPLPTEVNEGPSEPQVPTVVVVHHGKKKAQIVADLNGFTMYASTADEPRVSHCKKDCTARWRPVVSSGGKPQAGNGASPENVGSMLRDDGSYQVTFNDLPLYYFVEDTNQGDENGDELDEFGGHWTDDPPKHKKPKK